MGRGRAKAKQTKVARELKYQSYDPDFTSLERELRGESSDRDDIDDAEITNRYADLAAQYEDDDDEGYGLRKSG